ncbi:uncharacterized protein LY89DRAFT_761415 [Mollisia scopiformis]|uniref:NACHT domain-containing protein n=1 Tax=Mollisia scopiformis TaxID=149040 RepID=A0A132BBU0_MOLSC|nr:uncharacterized protein LY89DRAFT_761415 [Mollisia scopiformis]KUJ09733.1 hypothetical protein LY89DRAFT_761415 [Mollisia scopiformis]
MVGFTVSFSGSKVERQEQMATLLERKIKKTKEETWKLNFNGKDIPVSDLAQPVVGIIQWADDYISGALSANPYASTAWAGVSLLLPLALNPSKQAASFAQDLDYLTDVIVRSKAREDLYQQHRDSEQTKAYESSNRLPDTLYRDTLKKLYVENGAFRLGLDIVKWNDWDSALGEVRKRENNFKAVYMIWKDKNYQDDSERVFQQHQEGIDIMSFISRNTSGLRNAIEDAQRNTERINLLSWLSDFDPSTNYNTNLDKTRTGTGTWLLNNNIKFEEWKTLPNSFMWLNGRAGSGKSVLSASIVKHLKDIYGSNPSVAIAFFYFSFSNARAQKVDEMLCSLIKQICTQRPIIPEPVQSLNKYLARGQRPDRRTLEDALTATIRGFTAVYIVLDALDECPSTENERDVLLQSIERIHNTVTENLHMLCTSRQLTDIDEVLQPMASSTSASNVDLWQYKAAVDHDIGLHIDKRFSEAPFRSWPEDIQLEARTALIEKADGMFQYVACQFDNLKNHRTPPRIRAALKDLPKGLDDTYDRMLKGINPEYRAQVASALKWLAHSLRPLSLEELAELFFVDHEQDVPFNESDRFTNTEDVLNYLPGLVTKTKIPAVGAMMITEIRLVHFSCKEYLLSKRMTQLYFATPEEASHLHILSEDMLATHSSLRSPWELWKYAARYGPLHLEKIPLGS